MIFPLGMTIMTILLSYITAVQSGKILDANTFKSRVAIYMYIKAGICVLCLALVQLTFREPTNKRAVELHEESMKLGLCTQFKLLITDSTYNLFVFGPLISISFLGASDNHLFSLLAPFKYTHVKNSTNFF